MRKIFLISIVSSCLTLFIGALAQGSTTYTTLDVPGADATYAYGIDGGNIVGYYADGSSNHGFSFDGTTYTTLDMPGASNTYARGIDHRNIAGYYIDGSGVYRSFVAVIPEPTTLPLLALGMLLAWRRR